MGSQPSSVSAGDTGSRRVVRVGTIKDYPATGLMSGCGNSYFHRSTDARNSAAAYVFLCGPDGDNAWMNLNGRDTRLKLVFSKAIDESHGPASRWHSEYVAGSTRITIETSRRESDDDFTLAAKISIGDGKDAHVVEALGYSDC